MPQAEEAPQGRARQDARRETGRQDHYAVLGVPATASADEISRAYRQAARRLHPDAAGEASAARFAEAAEAYAVLGDADRRRRYDRERTTGRRSSRGGPVPVRVRRVAEPPADAHPVAVRVAWPDAVLGGPVRLLTPAGPVTVRLPAGTAPGTLLLVPGVGGAPDLLCAVEVDVPTALTDQERVAVERLAAVLRRPG